MIRLVGLVGLVLLLVLSGLGIGGCDLNVSDAPPEPEPEPLPVKSGEIDPEAEQRLMDSPWISPAVVEISNIYPGARAEWPLRVHNGGDEDTGFFVKYRLPGNLREGYEMPPLEAQDWVIVADPTPVLGAKETREILVVLAIPKSSEIPEESKFEFWISVIEDRETMIRTEMCSRWLVSMR